MDDIHIFIILFLALLSLCRISKEGFEEMEPGGKPVKPMKPVEEVVEEGEGVKVVEDVPIPPTMVKGKGPAMELGGGGFQGWDKRKVFSSPTAPNFGSLLELKEIQQLNNVFSKRNVDAKVPNKPIDSQMPSLSEGSTVPNIVKNTATPPQPPGGGPSGAVELHMVYADWCGHSKNALGDFEKLVNKTDVKTSSGKTVKFVLTEEKSDGMAEFKGKVKGFPSYMIKDGSELMPIDVGDRSESAIIGAAKKI